MKIKNLTHRLAATVSTLAITLSSYDALAQGLGDVAENITTSANNIPKMISTTAYICGIGLGVTGVFKLKAHVEGPDKVPVKDGLVRLAAGGGLLALPYMTEAMVGTVSTGSSQGAQFGAVNKFSLE